MPLPSRRALRLVAAAALLTAGLHARAQDDRPASSPEPVTNSALNAPLFYQLLIGEIELQNGQTGVAYQVLLDAARRTRDEALFRRVVNIAVQARAGDQAVGAAREWTEAAPDSVEAHQTLIQLLALVNRPAEVREPLAALLRIAPAPQRPGFILSLPRLFQRAPDTKGVLNGLAPVLQAQTGPLKGPALYTEARFAINAGENARALALTRELAQLMPEADDAMQLAIELVPVEPGAEALVAARLKDKPDQHALRIAYARALVKAQRPADAAREFRRVTEDTPDNASAWIALGAIELDLKHTAVAEAALREGLRLLDTPAAGSDAEVKARADARNGAWLLLAQAAEQRGDLRAADAALRKVDSKSLEVQYRRASLLARQGKLADARKLLHAAPDASDAEARPRLLAEAQLLREQRDFAGALSVLTTATERFKDDPDLLYERAMMAERVGRHDEMETLLRRVMALKPDYHHAYNALGYSLAERNQRLPEAKQLIEQALKLAPGDAFLVDSLGWVEFRLGNLAEAARLLRQAHASRPDAEIAAHLGEVLWASGEQDEARRVWQEAARRDPKNDALRETLQRLKVAP